MSTSAAMTTKLDGLSAWLLAALQVFDADFKVDDYLKKSVLGAMYRRERAPIMGDPVRYASVFYTRPIFPQDGSVLGSFKVKERIDQFLVQIWYGHEEEDGATKAESSQGEWDALLVGASGILTQLAELEWIDASAACVSAPEVRGDGQTILQMGDSERDKVHFIAFTLDLR